MSGGDNSWKNCTGSKDGPTLDNMARIEMKIDHAEIKSQ